MSEFFTAKEVVEFMRHEVANAGGARKWLRKNKVSGWDYAMHMISDGRAGTMERILPILGFRKVILYEAIRPDNGPDGEQVKKAMD